MLKQLLLILVLFIVGCSPYAPEELERLTKEDPEFAKMIQARNESHTRIKEIKDELLSKKKTLDGKIQKLRQTYDSYAKAQNLKIEKYRSAIEANRDLVRREVKSLEAQLSAKITELEGHEKTLEDVQKVIRETKTITLTANEKQRWEERVLMLTEKIRPLSDEIQELKFQIRLKKQKSHFLK